MFAILSGLGHGAVNRLKQTWEKLPQKTCRQFTELQALMDPSRNMSKYRSMKPESKIACRFREEKNRNFSEKPNFR